MEYYIEAGPATKRFIESVLPNMLSQLKLTKSRKFLHIKLDKEIENAGECIPLNGINTYLVVLKPKRDLSNLGITLAHELTHVAQFAKGILKVSPKGKIWNGKFYGRGVAYLQQPWEVQAFAKQEIIFRRAID
jgi:hypothetical protein